MTLDLSESTSYRVRLAEQTGRFFKAPDRDVQVVAVEHLRGGRGVEVFYTTELRAEAILTRFSWRWPIEVAFRDVKLDEPQNRVAAAARRTAPAGFLLYSVVVWWHETVRSKPAETLRHWPTNAAPPSPRCWPP